MGPTVSTLSLLTLAISITMVVADPDPLQDLCVADLTSLVNVNGYACKTLAPCADDFFTDTLASPAVTDRFKVTSANVMAVPGLNTLGVSLARIDIAEGGMNPPHVHPRATEMVYVVEGNVSVGFITTSNEHIQKELKVGQVFVFPRGMLHYQWNTGKSRASVISAFNSQMPGTVRIGQSLFAAKPEVPNSVLANAFMIGSKKVKAMKAKFAESPK